MRYNSQFVMRVAVVAGIGIMFVVSYLLAPEFMHRMTHLFLKGNIAGSIEFIRSYGSYAMLVSFLIIVFINIAAVLPNVLIVAATGVIFGVVEGTLISWIGESIGVIISFILMRYLFRSNAQSIIARSKGLKKIDDFSGKKGFRIMLLARSIPYIPSGLITALGALSSIGLADYSIATFIGKLPSALIEVMLGHDLLSYREHIGRVTLLLVIPALAYYLFVHYQKR
ncbi:MAG: associated protein [Firmicutes bacterium]|nr:associated protein [Bacillota bacterium]